MTTESDQADLAAARAAKYGHLPERIRPEQMVEEQPTDAPHDPDGGRNPETDFMLRYTT